MYVHSIIYRRTELKGLMNKLYLLGRKLISMGNCSAIVRTCRYGLHYYVLQKIRMMSVLQVRELCPCFVSHSVQYKAHTCMYTIPPCTNDCLCHHSQRLYMYMVLVLLIWRHVTVRALYTSAHARGVYTGEPSFEEIR